MMAQGGEQLGPDADSQMGIQLGFTEWPALNILIQVFLIFILLKLLK